MLIFPVQSIAYFHVVLVVRHTLKYLFLMVLNYRVIDAYIFLRYLVNKCTHIMHNLQQHMLRVLFFFLLLSSTEVQHFPENHSFSSIV